MEDLRIQAISAHDTLALRQKVLRPGEALDTLIYPGDLDAGSLHVGAVATVEGERRILGIASVYAQSLQNPPAARSELGAAGSWRLRGMATDELVRGTGAGGRLLTACINHAKSSGGKVLWCYARLPASGFYLRYGLRVEGEMFELGKLGPHYLMWTALSG